MRWFRRRRPAPVSQPLPKRLFTPAEVALLKALRRELDELDARAGDES